MFGVLICVGIVVLLLLVYVGFRLAGLGWYKSQQEILKKVEDENEGRPDKQFR